MEAFKASGMEYVMGLPQLAAVAAKEGIPLTRANSRGVLFADPQCRLKGGRNSFHCSGLAVAGRGPFMSCPNAHGQFIEMSRSMSAPLLQGVSRTCTSSVTSIVLYLVGGWFSRGGSAQDWIVRSGGRSARRKGREKGEARRDT